MNLRNGMRKNVWIEQDTLDWIKKVYPGMKLTWLVNNLLDSFIRSHDSNTSAVEEHLKTAIELSKEETKNGGY